jgi:twinkle protein
MADDSVVEMLRLPRAIRHNQPGYYTLADLPQQPSVASIARDTGWWEFDQIFKFYPGQFVLVSGVAGHGKSTFVFNLLHNVADRYSLRSFLYVPENERHVRAALKRIHCGKGGSEKSFDSLATHNFFVQSAMPAQRTQPPLTLDWVLEQAANVVERDSLDILLIDPWNELEHAKRKDQTLTEYVGESLMLLKAFARSLSVTIILVAHPTKAVFEGGKARVPGLADVEGSMNWYNKADNGLIVWREFGTNTAKVISAKVREHGAGKVGCCFFHVDEETGVFRPQRGAVG